MEVRENLEPSHFIEINPLLVNHEQENTLLPVLEFRMEDTENLKPSERITADPLAVKESFQSSVNSLLPVVKLEPESEVVVKSEFMDTESSGCEDNPLDTDFIKIEEEGFTETLVSNESNLGLSISRYCSENLTQNTTESTNGREASKKLTAGPIFENCNELLPVRKILIPSIVNTLSVKQPGGPMRAALNAATHPESEQQVKEAAHGNGKPDGVSNCSINDGHLMKSKLESLAPKETNKCMELSSSAVKPLEEKCCKQALKTAVNISNFNDTTLTTLVSATASLQAIGQMSELTRERQEAVSDNLKTSKSNFSSQVIISNEKKPKFVYVCSECSPHKHFGNKSFLDWHVKMFHPIWGCDNCTNFYRSRDSLEEHRKAVHHRSCTVCRKTFDTESQLKKHFDEEHICSILEVLNKEYPRGAVAGGQSVLSPLRVPTEKRKKKRRVGEKRQQNLCEEKQTGIEKNLQECSSGGSLFTVNGFPMPSIFAVKKQITHNNQNQSNLISEESQPGPSTDSTFSAALASSEKNSQREPFKKILSGTTSVSETVIRKKKLSELRIAALRVKKELCVNKVTLSSHELSRKQVIRNDKIHFIKGVGWGCDICGEFFAKCRHLKEHKINIHYNLNEFVCKTCQKTFESAKIFKQHGKNCGPYRYQCPVCRTLYAKMASYEAHYKLAHIKLPLAFTCSECSPNKQFDKKSDLRLHIVSQHVNKYLFPCKACGKRISGHKMADHLRIHERKKLECLHCKKLFTAVSSLQDHLKSHSTSENEVIACKFCGKFFESKPEYVKHLKEHEKERSFICEYCAKGFFSKYHLDTHLKIHDEKKFICANCNKGFVYKHQLAAHLRTITCSVDSKIFSKRSKKVKKVGKRKGKHKQK